MLLTMGLFSFNRGYSCCLIDDKCHYKGLIDKFCHAEAGFEEINPVRLISVSILDSEVRIGSRILRLFFVKCDKAIICLFETFLFVLNGE